MRLPSRSSSTVEKSRPSLKMVEYEVFIITSAISAALLARALCSTCRLTESIVLTPVVLCGACDADQWAWAGSGNPAFQGGEHVMSGQAVGFSPPEDATGAG